MKLGKGLPQSAGVILKKLERYKYVLLVLVVGIVLLMLPTQEDEGEAGEQSGSPSEEEVLQVEEMEDKLEETLSRVEGAGQVWVVLTLETGFQQIYAQDSNSSLQEGDNGHREEERTTVVVSGSGGVEQAVAIQRSYPRYQGALVVCSGGDDPVVQLALTEAVSALTGLGADQISICKGN